MARRWAWRMARWTGVVWWVAVGPSVVGVAWRCDVAWRAHLPISGLIPRSLLAILKTISCFYSKEFA